MVLWIIRAEMWKNNAINIVWLGRLGTICQYETFSTFAADTYYYDGATHREMNMIPIPRGCRPTHNKDITVLLPTQKSSRAVITNNKFMEAFRSRSSFDLAEINNRKLKFRVLSTERPR